MSQEPQKAEGEKVSGEKAEVTPATVGEIGLAEDLARADLYGLLAALLHRPPAQDLLDRIAASSTEADDSTALASVWLNLVTLTKIAKRGIGEKNMMPILLGLEDLMCSSMVLISWRDI